MGRNSSLQTLDKIETSNKWNLSIVSCFFILPFTIRHLTKEIQKKVESSGSAGRWWTLVSCKNATSALVYVITALFPFFFSNEINVCFELFGLELIEIDFEVWWNFLKLHPLTKPSEKLVKLYLIDSRVNKSDH